MQLERKRYVKDGVILYDGRRTGLAGVFARPGTASAFADSRERRSARKDYRDWLRGPSAVFQEFREASVRPLKSVSAHARLARVVRCKSQRVPGEEALRGRVMLPNSLTSE
jgi:hypothetical protein